MGYSKLEACDPDVTLSEIQRVGCYHSVCPSVPSLSARAGSA